HFGVVADEPHDGVRAILTTRDRRILRPRLGRLQQFGVAADHGLHAVVFVVLGLVQLSRVSWPLTMGSAPRMSRATSPSAMPRTSSGCRPQKSAICSNESEVLSTSQTAVALGIRMSVMGMDPGGCGPKNGRLNRRRPTFSAGREKTFIGDFSANENV